MRWTGRLGREKTDMGKEIGREESHERHLKERGRVSLMLSGRVWWTNPYCKSKPLNPSSLIQRSPPPPRPLPARHSPGCPRHSRRRGGASTTPLSQTQTECRQSSQKGITATMSFSLFSEPFFLLLVRLISFIHIPHSYQPSLPTAVAARFGIGRDFWLNLFLTLAGYIPGQ